MRAITLLLTATVNPGATGMVARRDPLVRLGDYESALSKWLSVSPPLRIVFCENTGFDLARLQATAAASPVEFISFRGNDGAKQRGKGYSEIAILEHALAESRLISASEVVVKCSGRLFVANAPQVFRALASTDFDVMCTLKQNLSFSDSRFFAATPQFLRQHLLPQACIVDDTQGIYFEHALACAVADAVAHRKKWRPFEVFPRIQGISGTHGKSMTDSAAVA